ncbi:odorant receptor Or2 [Plutella xylostella]|uniref:odorant receptor Or2 n=1 Tax=Plutella xylostella TaxID=51655 RepID=UPI00203302D8|nr:odorant receptor Or2 [Plutella xylostella]
MIKSFLRSLEHPKHPLLGPNICVLVSSGMLQYSEGIIKYFINSIHLFASLFILTQFYDLWLNRADVEKSLRDLSYVILSVNGSVKTWAFILCQKYWKDILESVSSIELSQLSKRDRKATMIIRQYTDYARKFTYFYWTLVTATVSVVVLAPFVSYFLSSKFRQDLSDGTVTYPEILSSWTPFDKTSGFGLIIYITTDVLICIIGGAVIASYDTTSIVLLIFFAGQLKLLKANCARIFGEDCAITPTEIYTNLRDCHRHHVFLVKYAKILNSLLSPVLFFYVITCSLMICASAVQFTMDTISLMHKLWVAEYLVALISQLFFYCWHGNYVVFKSEQVCQGIYESAWWQHCVPSRKSILLLGGQLRKRIVFTAGPFATLTIPTFITVMKGAYSYYTLLSKKEK